MSEMKFRQRPPLVFLIDALDECSDSQAQDVVDILGAWRIAAAGGEVATRICLSSRHYPNILMPRETFEELVVQSMKGHTSDIATFVRGKLPMTDSRIPSLVEKVLRKASGIFLWAVLVVPLLRQAYADGKFEAMQKKLDEVPERLDELFSTILNEENPNKHETVLMLQWVLFAVRPLSPDDLYNAMLAGTGTTNPGFYILRHSQLTLDDIKRRINSCSKGLIEVTDNRSRVQFIHESVSDFLRQNTYQWLRNLDTTLGTNPVGLSHERLMTCCVSFIQEYSAFDVLEEDDRIANYDPDVVRFDHPFAAYAAEHWVNHAEAAETERVSQIKFLKGHIRDGGMERVLLAHRWLCCDEEAAVHNVSCRHDVDLLYIFLRHGHKKIAMSLVEHGADIMPQGRGYDDWDYDSALYISVLHNDPESVKLFLDHGADPDSSHMGSNVFEKALESAESDDNVEVIRLLLDYGADVNAIGSDEESTLSRAIKNFEKPIVMIELLLDPKYDVNAQYEEYNTNALHDAALWCDENIVRRLNKGAEVGAIVGGYGTALQTAAYSQKVKVVKLLLERGANIDAPGGEFGCALQAAALSGHREVRSFLWERSYYANDKDIKHHHTLQTVAVALHSSYEITRLLLDRGGNPNAQGGKYGTALQAAAFSMSKETVKLLLELRVNLNAQGGEFGTALQAAATAPFMWRADDPRDMDVVRLLLEHGANVNAQGGKYGSALQAAISEGREDIAILFLDHGAIINAQADKDDTALTAATKSTRGLRGYDEDYGGKWKAPDITQMFPTSSASICTWKGKYGHALQMAVLRGEIRLVTLLLKHGADVNYRTEQVHPPLILAASKHNTELATLLLDHGADVNGECGPMGNALQWIICLANTSLQMVALVLRGEYGADVHRVCGPFGTALKAAEAFGRHDIALLLRQHGAVM
ncbi:ankyrin repeat-containing domain protein [Sordaria brevicollis]|uniref:Ankyrin repeat-containing domain protein n=1 Tax=Sordaria brevicollis TaxID=83679 RepID=A0AAE0UFK5_SORBR|nr:ankyrin repeat-containing domain protein [Sordaria brevicollis]